MQIATDLLLLSGTAGMWLRVYHARRGSWPNLNTWLKDPNRER